MFKNKIFLTVRTSRNEVTPSFSIQDLTNILHFGGATIASTFAIPSFDENTKKGKFKNPEGQKRLREAINQWQQTLAQS